VLVDLFGNRTVLRFSELVENAGVEDAAFEIQVPKDTEVIDLR
jgi:outer membrane lipoprotein-sorting protein